MHITRIRIERKFRRKKPHNTDQVDLRLKCGWNYQLFLGLDNSMKYLADEKWCHSIKGLSIVTKFGNPSIPFDVTESKGVQIKIRLLYVIKFLKSNLLVFKTNWAHFQRETFLCGPTETQNNNIKITQINIDVLYEVLACQNRDINGIFIYELLVFRKNKVEGDCGF